MIPLLHIEHRGTYDLYKRIRLLGQGNSVVDEVQHSSGTSASTYARKSFKLPTSDAESVLANIKSEINTMSRLRHRHIAEFVSSYEWQTEDLFCILMLPVAETSLASVLHKTDRTRPTSSKRRDNCRHMRRWPACLLNALQYIHSEKIRHKDIKPENILVDKDGDVVLTDFGISRDVAGLTTTKTSGKATGTWLYAAPEVEREEKRGRSADVYSLGCVMLEICAVCSGDEGAIGLFRERLWGGANPRSASYSEHQPQLLESILILLSIPKRDPELETFVTQLLQLTFLMLDPDRNTRITAEVLIDMLKGGRACGFPDVRDFACESCQRTATASISGTRHLVFRQDIPNISIDSDADGVDLWKATRRTWVM